MAGTGTAHLRDGQDALLRVENLVVEFNGGSRPVRALDGISLSLKPGEVVTTVSVHLAPSVSP